MSDAYVFDAVRTPRGRGRASGSLREVSPLRLAAGVLKSIRDRNDLDTSQVDDVILGVADPVNEQGADIARTAVLVAGYDQGTPGVQINRFCASGLEFRSAGNFRRPHCDYPWLFPRRRR
jgi:acetyl-CoA C-acetyltransferase